MGELRIAVLGAGNSGWPVGRKWMGAGHGVAFGVTNPAGVKAEALRTELGNKVSIDSIADVLAAGDIDVVVFAVPGAAMDEIIAAHAAQLDGKIIIDTANRMGGGPMNSFATFQARTPHAHIYRAFNSLGWENFADPEFNGIQADLFCCGPDGNTRELEEQLITDFGLRAVWLGAEEQVRLVHSLGAGGSGFAVGRGKGRHLAFKVLTR